MSLTLAKIRETVLGNERAIAWDVTFDSSYVAGGMAVSAANVGLSQIVGARFLGGNAAAAKYLWQWDVDNSKIIASYPTGGDQTSPSALADAAVAAPAAGTFAVTTTPDSGSTPMTGSAAKPALAGVISGALAAPAMTPGRGKELQAATDASSLKVRFEFFGY